MPAFLKERKKKKSLKVFLCFQEKAIQCDLAVSGTQVMQLLKLIVTLAAASACFVISEPGSKLLETDSRR